MGKSNGRSGGTRAASGSPCDLATSNGYCQSDEDGIR